MSLNISVKSQIAFLEIDRPKKANAIDQATLAALRGFFENVPEDVKVVVLSGNGKHFCSGLDLTETRTRRSSLDGIERSKIWHQMTEKIRFGRVPTIAVMQGGVLGGGLEIASSCHVRIADRTAFFGLPEAERGVFVGGGALVRVRRLIGAARMTEMMLTNRQYSADDAFRIGLCDYVVDEKQGLVLAVKLAEAMAQRSPVTNYFAIHSVYHAEDTSESAGLFLETLTSAFVRTTPESSEGLSAFAEKRKPKFDSK